MVRRPIGEALIRLLDVLGANRVPLLLGMHVVYFHHVIQYPVAITKCYVPSQSPAPIHDDEEHLWPYTPTGRYRGSRPEVD